MISPVPEPSLFDMIKQKAMSAWQNFANPAPTRVMFTQPTPTPSVPQVSPDRQMYQDAIQKGFEHWGNPPAATLSGVYAEAPQTADIFKKYPFLLPAQSIAETSGGAKQKFDNNPQNWGIVPQAHGSYSPSSPEQVIRDAMTAIGGTRTPATHTPSQVSNQSYYEDFRNSGDLMDFAKNYAPPTENDTAKYVQDLISIMSVFESAMGKPMSSSLTSR